MQSIALLVVTIIKTSTEGIDKGFRIRDDVFFDKGTSLVGTTLLTVFVIYDNYSWILLLMNRIYSRRRFGETYNDLLVIDHGIHIFDPMTQYADKIRSKNLFRLTFLAAENILETYQDYHMLSLSVEKLIIGIFHRAMKDFAFNQMLNAFDTLAIQTATLSEIVEKITTVKELRQAHRVLNEIIESSKRANKTFSIQLAMEINGGTLFILFNLFEIVMFMQKDGLEVLFDIKMVIRWINALTIGGFYMILAIYQLSVVKNALQDVLIKFQEASERLNIASNSYLLARAGFDKNFAFTIQNYVTINNMKTIFTVSFGILSATIYWSLTNATPLADDQLTDCFAGHCFAIPTDRHR